MHSGTLFGMPFPSFLPDAPMSLPHPTTSTPTKSAFFDARDGGGGVSSVGIVGWLQVVRATALAVAMGPGRCYPVPPGNAQRGLMVGTPAREQDDALRRKGEGGWPCLSGRVGEERSRSRCSAGYGTLTPFACC